MKQFIIDRNNGSTESSIRYLNDSIRTYSWLIIGSQVQSRTTIIGSGKELNAQHQYLQDVEAAIAREENLSKSISDYQDTLKYARSKLDYAVAYGCYMCPCNMNLKIVSVNDYNDLIQEATDDMKIGQNPNNNYSIHTKINSIIKQNTNSIQQNTNNQQNINNQQQNINYSIQTNNQQKPIQQNNTQKPNNSKNIIMTLSFGVIGISYSFS